MPSAAAQGLNEPGSAVPPEMPRERLRPTAPGTLMRRVRKAVGRELLPVTGFSLAVNLLALVSSIYMMELFDRVLTSGSHGTLL